MAILDELAVDPRVFGELAADFVHQVVHVQRVEGHLVRPNADQRTCAISQYSRPGLGEVRAITEFLVQPGERKRDVPKMLLWKSPKQA